MLVHPKDRIPRDKQNVVVYQISCGNCNETFIGQTKIMVEQIKEHKSAE